MKNKFNIQKMWSVLLLMLMGLMTISCNRDDVTPPKDEHQEHGHDKWSRVEIILREAHGHGGGALHTNPLPIGKYDYIFPKVQKLILEQTPSGVVKKREFGQMTKADGKLKFAYVPVDSDKPFEVRSSSTKGTGYIMQIFYYNTKGELVNNQFLTPEVLATHQLFFYTKEYFDLKTGKSLEKKEANQGFIEGLYDFIYRDGLSTNMGLKGNFFFTKHNVKFDMTFRMSHIIDKNNKISGVNPPEKLILSGDADFEQKIPFVVIEEVERYSVDEDDYYSNVMDYYKLKGQIEQEELDDELVGMDREYPEDGNFEQ